MVTLGAAARGVPPSLWVIALLALLGGIPTLVASSRDRPDGLTLWVFSPTHQAMYAPLIDPAPQGLPAMDMHLFSPAALERKMMSGFLGGLPTADLIEAERAFAGRAFAGPLDAVGFLDLTERLRDSGLMDQINAPSFSAWTSRGRIFGLPHDVHPVMLAYRADLTEAAGIDLPSARTWDEFAALLAPLTGDANADGEPDRYALGFWYTQPDNVELLVLQGDGRLFDDSGRPTLDTPRNAELIARMVSWCVGPTRIAADVEDFTAAGHQQRLDGYAIAYLCPDWMCSIWKEQIPQAAGRFKVMPLPAFEQGGRRTSVRGGTMLGIPKATPNPEAAWQYALRLYTAPETAERLYRQADIITPVRSLWGSPWFDEPDAYFSGQAKGRMFIELADDVPLRPSSVYNRQAVLLVRDAAVALADHARRVNAPDHTALIPEATRLLDEAQQSLMRTVRRDPFAVEPSAGAAP
jgi:arabinosaccharide transport system substrate-binding protein